MASKLNCIKTALEDNGKTNKWLAEQLGKDSATVSMSAVIGNTHADSQTAGHAS